MYKLDWTGVYSIPAGTVNSIFDILKQIAYFANVKTFTELEIVLDMQKPNWFFLIGKHPFNAQLN